MNKAPEEAIFLTLLITTTSYLGIILWCTTEHAVVLLVVDNLYTKNREQE